MTANSTNIVLAALDNAKGPMTIDAIVETTGLKRRAAAVIATQLQRKGHVTWDEATGAQITEEGCAALTPPPPPAKKPGRPKGGARQQQKTPTSSRTRKTNSAVAGTLIENASPEEVEIAEATVENLKKLGIRARLEKTERIITDVRVVIDVPNE